MHAVVVSFDCLPIAWTGCYGNMSIATPRLDALGAQSVVFDACYAADITPGRSAERGSLREHCRDTGVSWFEECNAEWAAARRAGRSTLAWLQRPGACAPKFDDAEQAAAARAAYGARVIQRDAELGRWLDEHPEALAEDTLLIVTAASGAVLFPHPGVARGCPEIVDPLVHVPLLVRAGDSKEAGTRRRGLVSSVDLAATLCGWLGIPCRLAESRSLLPVLRGEAESVRESVCFEREGVGRGVRTERFTCLCRSGLEIPEDEVGWDFTGRDRPWLFVKPDDAWDMLDVAGQHPEELDGLLRALGLRS